MILAHHEALLVAQAVGGLGLTGYAAAIVGRWMSVVRMRTRRPEHPPASSHATAHIISTPPTPTPVGSTPEVRP